MKFLVSSVLSLWCFVSTAQSIDTLSLINFSDAVLELQNSELLRNGSLAVTVKSVRDGKTIFALNQQRSLPSASILKLVSTATALSVFGADYRFQTFLEYDGVIRNDTLFGNIYVRGAGDPSLGSDRFEGYPGATQLLTRWAGAINKLRIKAIGGQVIGDASFFDARSVADSWIWADLGNYYGAGVQGLNFNENLYKVKFKPGARMGDPAIHLETEPAMPQLTFINQVLTGEKGSGDQTVFYGNPQSDQVIFTGTVPMGFSTYPVKGSIPDPPAYVANALKEAVIGSGIMFFEAPAPRSGEPLAPLRARKTLDEYKSPPLRELCQQTNFWSINLFADAFLKQIGKRLTGNSEYEAAAKAMTDYWVNRQVDLRGFYIKDGSGLSPSGSVTTANITDILNHTSKDVTFKDFYDSIAILGQSGTVRNLGKRTKAAGSIRVKSGSIEGTRAFAGYVNSKSGELLSFAIIANKYLPGSQRTVTDELVKVMILMAAL